MDITRGSRRARHVAAAHANAGANANANAAASSPSGPGHGMPSSPFVAGTPSGSAARLPPGHGASPAAGLVTPDGPPLHRTPDQPPDQRRRRAPPPNPFRLYRMPSYLIWCNLRVFAAVASADNWYQVMQCE
ncbi:hypothetical protein FSARC_4913 [Fusarium sarcochroum]|uniref:Uncharacterized protein n=1 Tax=Fusarium sarcochroum TaxID=1208366 RepID=A0A8H4U0I7_9HYPO|nr:hypothetical protein FSARC_4913 [Fusarium sarcochroum]